jgi:hypothetical protein
MLSFHKLSFKFLALVWDSVQKLESIDSLQAWSMRIRRISAQFNELD